MLRIVEEMFVICSFGINKWFEFEFKFDYNYLDASFSSISGADERLAVDVVATDEAPAINLSDTICRPTAFKTRPKIN